MINGKKVLGIIPARGGSKGVPGKNIKALGGKPLIAHSIEEAKKSRFLSTLIVSTDSEEIANISKSFGAEVPFLRPQEFATDKSLSIDVVHHALKYYQEKHDEHFDYVVLLQPTTPFRTAQDIDQSLEMLDSNDCDTIVSVVDVGANHPARMYSIADQQLKSVMNEEISMMPRQDLPPVYIRSGDVYAAKIKTIQTYNSLMGKRCFPLIIPQGRAINIDTINDFQAAELLVASL
jgi:CMP-N,N'-diacetyllegionaminic acid synthase